MQSHYDKRLVNFYCSVSYLTYKFWLEEVISRGLRSSAVVFACLSLLPRYSSSIAIPDECYVSDMDFDEKCSASTSVYELLLLL